MTTPLAHPLVNAYLRDLEMLLHGVEPVERAEVLGGVREHLDASLVPGASDAEVRAVLAEVGLPHAVADEAYAGRPANTLSPPQRPRWLAPVACTLNGIFVVLFSVVIVSQAAWPELLFSAQFYVLPWLVVLVLTTLVDSWSMDEKFQSIGLIPGLVVSCVLVSWITQNLLPWWAVGVLLCLGLCAAAVWLLSRLVRRTRQAHRTHR